MGTRMVRLSPHKPMFYVRFIDDIFMIWDKGLDNLQTFFNLANSFHPSIKFTFDYSLKEVPFLDVLVTIEGGKTITSVYTKPTDRHTYLHFHSFHPRHTKTSVVYSQFLRYRRLCSTDNTFLEILGDTQK
ncbi:hypothetical protein HOLleu_08061 [Holothuria leucospilota]|uniref:Helix-turn-helix domain-containing protein n=1 Tax=Holothuria leucospilota TaxID=206669 RepID=A0A9Q1CGZ0_HOLLE|nr:hypothetical protein HOLleu_08061 [Holothuria leucospilota]